MCKLPRPLHTQMHRSHRIPLIKCPCDLELPGNSELSLKYIHCLFKCMSCESLFLFLQVLIGNLEQITSELCMKECLLQKMICFVILSRFYLHCSDNNIGKNNFKLVSDT